MTDQHRIDPDLVAPLPGDAEGVRYLSLEQAERLGVCATSKLPRTLRIFAETMLRRAQPGEAMDLSWLAQQPRKGLVEFNPTRLLLQDFTGLPLMTDLASMRDALAERGVDPRRG